MGARRACFAVALIYSASRSVAVDVKAMRRATPTLNGASTGFAEQGLVDWLETHPDPAGSAETAEFFKNTAALALKARGQIEVAQAVPEEIFLTSVLPYRFLDEPLDDWRPKLFHALAEHVSAAKSLRQAAELAYPRIWNHLREDVLGKQGAVVFKGNSTPQVMAPISETLQDGFASCTGCSILVAAAFRSVGIPARVVGTAEWETGGNHNWVEVWTGEGSADGWEFFDAAPQDAIDWNKAWFVPDNVKGAKQGTKLGIYTPTWPRRADVDNHALLTSGSPAMYNYTWRTPYLGVPAEDRTEFYTRLAQANGL